MRNGRAVQVDAADSLARHEWVVVAEASGRAGGARLLLGAPLDMADVEARFGDAIELSEEVRFEAATGGVVAERTRRLGAITLSRAPLSSPDPAKVAAALREGLRQTGVGALTWSAEGMALRARAAFAGLADLSDTAILGALDFDNARRLSDLDTDAALAALLDWPTRQALDRIAPARLETPAGTSHAIDYAAEAGPTVALRVQELFGMTRHPMAGQTPLVLSLLSPAHRPIQTTRDLPGFWRGSWKAVQAEMKGRYPRHPWPDDPAAAPATTRTKRADARRS